MTKIIYHDNLLFEQSCSLKGILMWLQSFISLPDHVVSILTNVLIVIIIVILWFVAIAYAIGTFIEGIVGPVFGRTSWVGRCVFIGLIILLFLLLLSTKASAEVLDISYDNNKNGPSVSTLVLAGEPVRQISTILIADTSGYREALIGTYLTLGDLTVMPHVGVECVRGSGCKGRVFVSTSLLLGQSDQVVFSTVHEAGGVTGNFHKASLSYQVFPSWRTMLVYHRVAGWGGRVDFTADKRVTPYVQVLERRLMAGVSLTFKFDQ